MFFLFSVNRYGANHLRKFPFLFAFLFFLVVDQRMLAADAKTQRPM